MSGKELDVFDAKELIRRLQLKQSGRTIAREMRVSRETVKCYRELGEREGWLDGHPLPEAQEIQKARSVKKAKPAVQETSSVLPYKAQVEELLKDSKMTVAVIRQRLAERGYSGSYSSVNRFVSRLRDQNDPEGFCRMEVPPGSQP